jgi:glutamate synthase (NADPH/NADH)
MTQMKERYTTMRPYGEWLAQETVSLQQLMDSVPAELRIPPPVVPASASASLSNGAHVLV